MATKKKQPAPKKTNVVPLKKAAPPKVETFVRVVELDMKPGDTFRGYQPEVLEVLEGQIVSRRMVDKPNMFEYAQAHAIDLVDPRNAVAPARADELA